MNVVTDAMADLAAAIEAGTDITATTTDASQLGALPAVLLGPPRLLFTAGRVDPTDMELIAYVIVDADERAVEHLLELAIQVAHALDERMPDAAVTQASPGVFPSGATQLPCYEVQIEVGL